MEENSTLQSLHQEQVNALVDSAKHPENAVRFELTNKVSDKLKNDENVGQRLDKSADRVVDAGLTTVENEVESSVIKSEKDKLQAYFEQHKEELKTAGIEEQTYLEDMERAVKWHRKCARFHWFVCGWWMTLIRTFNLKAKPFKWLLNTLGTLLNIALLGGIVFGIIKLIEIL
jgi:hypothetical protein